MRSRLRALVVPPNPSRTRLREWVQRAAQRGTGDGFRVLDAGAGPAPYRDLFGHVSYETADFEAYAGTDHVCDLAALPMADESYELILCTQVLEHVPDPLAVLKELRRVLVPGGEVWVSAPLFYAEHQQPYDFYRYTRYAWEHMARESGLMILEIEWLEGYYGTLSYQLSTAAAELPRRYFPLRGLFLALSHWFARAELRRRVTDRGMNKNYQLVLKHPE